MDSTEPWHENLYVCFGLYNYSTLNSNAEMSHICQTLCMFSCRYENAFLVSLVGLRPEKYFWTGLSNTEDRNMFKWTTERAVTFTNFNVGMPGTLFNLIHSLTYHNPESVLMCVWHHCPVGIPICAQVCVHLANDLRSCRIWKNSPFV